MLLLIQSIFSKRKISKESQDCQLKEFVQGHTLDIGGGFSNLIGLVQDQEKWVALMNSLLTKFK